MNIREQKCLEDEICKNIDEYENKNKKLNSFFTDNSIYFNKNNYRDFNLLNSNVNTTQNNVSTYNNFNENEMINSNYQKQKSNSNSLNDELNQMRFDTFDKLVHNNQVNKVSPFISQSIKNKKADNYELTSKRIDEHSAFGRSYCAPHNIKYEINESFLNPQHNKKKNSDITNERLEQFSPLSKTSPIQMNRGNDMNHLDAENTFTQSCLKTDYKSLSKGLKYTKNKFDDVNRGCVNTYLSEVPKGTRLN